MAGEPKAFEIFPKNPKKTYGLMELVKGTSPIVEKEPEKTVFTFPHLFYIEFLNCFFVTIILILLSLWIDAPLEEPASKDTTPNPMKAPWYFLGLQELLVFFDPWIAGVVLPVLIIVGLMLIPFLDTNPKGKGYYTYSERKFAIISFAFGLALWYILIVIGVWTRGLDWNWYWPWENWEVHKPIAVGLEDFPVILVNHLGISELLANGIADLIVIGYFIVGLAIPYFFLRNFYNSLGLARYTTLVVFYLIMLGIPIKIALRLIFDIKYMMITPWFKI
ncbi:MAG: cytochrome B6 [Nitrospirae bacterium]|nr:cytochrome B6 [Nitrospirota bacterium]